MFTVNKPASDGYLANAFLQTSLLPKNSGKETKDLAEIAGEFHRLFTEQTEANMFAGKKAAIDYLWEMKSSKCAEILLAQVNGVPVLHSIIFSQIDDADWGTFTSVLRALPVEDRLSCLGSFACSDFFKNDFEWPHVPLIGACEALLHGFGGGVNWND
ncbi:MAG: hypothetical protein LBI61_03280 [Puniceicoccales bacterium]|jgi:hypothetical protein|nr:hypothetical protein [Puniceicoccales bacterium]